MQVLVQLVVIVIAYIGLATRVVDAAPLTFGVCVTGSASAEVGSAGFGSGQKFTDTVATPDGCQSTLDPFSFSADAATGDFTETLRNGLTGRDQLAHMNAEASIGGTGSMGRLVASAAAAAASSLDGPVNGTSRDPSGWGSSGLNALWFDSVLVTSSYLPAGTPVDLLFTLTLEGEMWTAADGTPNLANNFTTASSVLQAGPQVVRLDALSNAESWLETTLLLHSSVGARVSIEGQLILRAAAGSSAGRQTYSALASTDFVSNVFLEVLTPGGAYLADSGATYLATETGGVPGEGAVPVPEPASLPLLGSGAAALLAQHRRRRAA